MAAHTAAAQKLLDLADAYEHKAKVLREAAAELNGHEVTKSVGTIASKLRQAGALRGETPNKLQVMEARRAAVQELLVDGKDYKIKHLAAALRERGYEVDHSTVNNDLHALHATKTGNGKYNAVWHLASSNGHHPPTRVAKPKAAMTGKRRGGLGKKKRAQREASAKLLARIAASDTPVSKNLGRSIGALLRRGYVRKTDDGYVRTDKDFTV